MSIIPKHKYVAPLSLNNASAFTVDLTGISFVSIQADLLTTPLNRVYVYISEFGGSACSLSNAERYLVNGQNIDLVVDGMTTPKKMYILTTDSTGAAANCGANDYLRIFAEVV